MTIRDFYYTEEGGGETIRVEAESYQQLTEPAKTGQCPTYYNVRGFYRYYFDAYPDDIRRQTFSIGGSLSNRTYGPIGGLQPGLDRNNLVVLYLNHYTLDGTPTKTPVRTFSRGLTYISSEITSIHRFDGQPDNCGEPGACGTKFYREAQVIHEIGYCPPVTEEPPEDACCDCWQQAAAIARTIRV